MWQTCRSSLTTKALQIFRRIPPLPLLPQELRRYDPLDAMLQPLVPERLAFEASYRSLESLLFPARSTEYLPWCHRKRCAPRRAKWFRKPANTQNCDASRVQAIPTPSDPLQQDYAP